MQHPLREAAPTGYKDRAMCALGEQIVRNPNEIKKKKSVTCLNAFESLDDLFLPVTPAS